MLYNILAVDRIITKKLKLEDATLKVKELQEEFKKTSMITSGSIEVNTVYITGLKDRISKDTLELNLENMACCDVDNIVYGVTKGVAMVHFASKPGVCISLIAAICYLGKHC